jgi:hypothetical protein
MFNLLKMLDQLFFCPEVVKVFMMDEGFFSSRNREGTLDDHVLEIQNEKLRLTSQKNCSPYDSFGEL